MILAVAQVVAAGITFNCTPTAVWDGDGPIWCAEGPKVRLAGIAAREMDGTCNPAQPCPAASAGSARDALVNLLGGAKGQLKSGHIRVRAPAMRCRSDGGAGGNRTAAWCVTAADLDINCTMMRSGTTLRWRRYWGNHRCR